MRKIAVINQKGGVGKTTSAVNLSAALAAEGHSTLLVDLDPQAHASLHLGVTLDQHEPNVYQVLTTDAAATDVCRPASDHLWLMPSHIDLAATEVELADMTGRELVLRHKLSALEGRFDYCLIDCPPSLGILTLNALVAVDEVLIPLQPHFLALHGLSKLLETIDLVSRRLNPGLKVLGVILCLYESNTRLANEVSRDVDEFFDHMRSRATPWSEARAFSTRVRRNIRLAESPSFGKSIFDYAPASGGAEDYRQLCQEIFAPAVLSTSASAA